MKTPLIYGALMAIIGALVTYGLFFAGYHDTPEKLQASSWISTVVGVLAAVTCLALAMRERRAQHPVDQSWGYGSAFGTGVLTGLWAALFGAVLAYVYFAIINPQFGETVYQAQVAKMEAKGASSSQIDAASGFMRKFVSPVAMTLVQGIGGFIWSVILSLLVAIFFRKRDVVVETTETAAPPPLA
jgi:hypothetical protein